MKQYLAGRIRNIALTGHSDSGKTSLAEALLFKAGASDRLGKISEGNTVCDFDPEEIKRQVSVSTSIAPFAWGSTKINLIDTPGLFDFAGEAAEGARAVESLLITVSGKSGVDVGTEKAYKMAEKVLREHADGLKELAELLLSREVVFTEDVERIFGRRKKDIERERREAEAKAKAEGGKPAGEEPQAGKQAAAVADPSAKSDKSETAEPAPVAPAVAAPETE